MRLVRAAVLLSGMLLLGACSDPRSTKLPVDIEQWNTEIKKEVSQLKDEEKQRLMRYVLRKTKIRQVFGELGPVEETTIGEALTAQKQFEDNQGKKNQNTRRLKDRAQQSAMQAFDNTLAFSINDKSLQEKDYSPMMLTNVSFQNKSAKNIEGIKGTIDVQNMFDDSVISLDVKYDDIIPANSIATVNLSFDYNRLIEDHQAFMSTGLNKLKVSFYPEQIVFTDGSKLEMPVMFRSD